MKTIERSIYYLGNKAKSASLIAQLCKPFFGQGDYIIDLFSGSGAVAREFSYMGNVITNDVQRYSQIICEALLLSTFLDSKMVRTVLSSARLRERVADLKSHYQEYIVHEAAIANATIAGAPNTERERQRLIELLFRSASRDHPVIRTHAGIYFTVKAACALQALYEAVSLMPPAQNSVGKACLFAAASRCSITVGNQFAQPQKLSAPDGRAKISAARTYLSALSKDPIEYALTASAQYPAKIRANSQHQCLLGEDLEVARRWASGAKLFYLDPPYGREHYSRFYHVLEDLAVDRFSDESALRSRMRPDRFQSKYSLRAKAFQSLSALLDTCRDADAPVAISYVDESEGKSVENRIIPVELIRTAVRERYSNCAEFVVSSRNYSQLNRLNIPESRRGIEILLVGNN